LHEPEAFFRKQQQNPEALFRKLQRNPEPFFRSNSILAFTWTWTAEITGKTAQIHGVEVFVMKSIYS
jgi:hypothetical protein